MSKSRSKNMVLNVAVGVGVQILIIIFSFINRMIFVKFLNVEYLGINGLYSNILSILALAELGLGTVTQFYFYKPVAENNYKLISALSKYFYKLYLIVAVLISVIGICLIPFLKYIIKGSELNNSTLIIYYILFLLNSVLSYFCASKVSLFSANQHIRIQKYTNLITTLLGQVLYICVLSIYPNYYLYILVSIFITVVNVILINKLATKQYPFLLESNNSILSKEYRKKIWKDIKSTFIYRIGAVLINSTDNILISMLVGISSVGIYSNYYMLMTAVQSFISIMTVSLISGIGNLSVTKNKTRIKVVFDTLLFVYHIIAIYGFICFYFLFNKFILIWLGENYLFKNSIVLVISFNFYLSNAISPVWMYREANGLYGKVKYLLIITAVLNICFSVILGQKFGVIGILLATLIARIFTQVWYEPMILYKIMFQKSSREYWIKQFKYMFFSLLIFMIAYAVNIYMFDGMIGLVLSVIVFSGITLFVFFFCNRKSLEVQTIIELILNFGGIKHAVI